MGSGNICAQCFRVLFIVINAIVLLIGLAILGVGIYATVQLNQYEVTGSNHYISGGIILIVAGVVTFVIAGVGFVGACLKWRPLLVVYIIALTLIIILEILAGILGLVFRDRVMRDTESQYRENLLKAIDEYDMDDDKGGLDTLQENLKCCGADNYTDWLDRNNNDINNTIPSSCNCSPAGSKGCEEVFYDVNGRSINQTVFTKGCIDATIDFTRRASYIIGGVGIAFGIFEILGIIIAVGLVIWITRTKEGYEVV